MLTTTADEVDDIAGEDDPERLRDRFRSAAGRWLGEARRVTHEIPEVGAVLERAEEGRAGSTSAA